MAEERVEFELVTPERLVVSRGVDMVVVPGAEGDFGVLPRHTPMISTVRPGVVRVWGRTMSNGHAPPTLLRLPFALKR